MRIGALLLLLLRAAPAGAEDSAFTFRPAHWVDGDEIEPTLYVSPFGVLTFPSAREGWLAGERYVLHVQGDRLEVAFVDLGHSVRSFGFSSPTIGWAGSQDEQSGPILSFREGTWRRERPAGIEWPYWGIYRVMAGHDGEAWATAWFTQQPPDAASRPKRERGLLHYAGAGWAIDRQMLVGHDGVVVADACQSPDNSWWVVGTDRAAPSGAALMLARWDGRSLQTVAAPVNADERSALSEVRCLPDGSAWALGSRHRGKDEPAEILVMRFDTRWERVPIPSIFPREPAASALAPVGPREAWVSASCGALQPDCCERFLHYRDGSWETVGLPLMPGGRCTKVRIDDMQFVSPDEGWAVATDLEPRLGAGRIFHYKDGQWRLRNWNWHFWDAPWFNLFG